MPSPLPRSTTLVSPVTMRTPAARAAAPMSCTMRASVAMGSPSSRMKPALSTSGVAPLMARSFTVPCTASVPMLPPGKMSGLTTNESVEYATRAPGSVSTVLSLSEAASAVPKAGRNRCSTSSADSCPPPP
jgi:hypothetical protein